MKAVLISIQPKWCELIASGKKTVEVRKSNPTLETPFKCYIYETKGKSETPTFVDEEGHIIYDCGGVVIGEFVCDWIDYVRNYGDVVDAYDVNASCLSAAEIINYAKDKNGKFVYTYGWHISELEIYDKPKELSEFKKGCNDMDDPMYGSYCEYCENKCYLKRPPQSWCYVEEI